MTLCVDEQATASFRDRIGSNVPLRLGFLASHGGSSMAAIIKALNEGLLATSAQVLISNNGHSRALGIAQEAAMPAFHLSEKTVGTAEDLDCAIRDTLIHHGVMLVVCSGYMKKIGPQTLAAFTGRILNVHPALLPAHGGQGMYGARVHAAVLAAGETTTGVTIHVVDGEYDHGPILAQATVPLFANDTIDSLAARVSARENTLYVEVLKRIVGSEGRQGP